MDYQLEHGEVDKKNVKFPICVVANDFNVPMNVGSLFRLADALGISKLYLSGSSPTPPNRKINKTARSTTNFVAYEYVENALDTVIALKQEGYLIVSLEITKNSIDINNFKIENADKICLIIGSENQGIHQSLLDISDQVIHIPMFGKNSSMNVATASAIALFELVKQLSDKG